MQCSITFFSKIVPFNAEKYGSAKGTTNDVTIWRIRFACWISKATCMHTHEYMRVYTHKYVISAAYPRQQ
jgi:hypothetical protein